jgi:hypothetical protein
MTTNLTVGQKVEIRIPDDHCLYTTAWWPKRGVQVTGEVQKIFKNGKVAVAVDQVKNKSEDRRHTMNWESTDCLIPIS